jgi:TPR repeat protein
MPATGEPAAATSAKPQETATPKPGPAPETDDHSASDAAAKDASSHNSSVVAKPKTDAARAASEEPDADPHANKMLLLGEKYLYGQGVARNCNQALVYFRAAADEDNAPAMSHLGAMYASGNCVTMNRATAYSWFARAGNADPNNQWLTRNLNMLWRDMTPQERATVNR